MNACRLPVFVEHLVQNNVAAAYARSDVFVRSRRLMDDWEAYVYEERGQVLPRQCPAAAQDLALDS